MLLSHHFTVHSVIKFMVRGNEPICSAFWNRIVYISVLHLPPVHWSFTRCLHTSLQRLITFWYPHGSVSMCFNDMVIFFNATSVIQDFFNDAWKNVRGIIVKGKKHLLKLEKKYWKCTNRHCKVECRHIIWKINGSKLDFRWVIFENIEDRWTRIDKSTVRLNV